MTTNEKGHRGDEITAYLSETLEPEEKAAFEAHLADCKDCQEEVAAQRALFDDVNKALAFKRKRSIDEQVARFEREVAAERAEASAKVSVKTSVNAPVPAQRYRRRWAVPAAVALAASAAAVFVVLGRPGGGVGPGAVVRGEDAGAGDGIVAAPRRPAGQTDGGVDGGGVPSP
jgi:anti-sigma factor RsiW